MDKYTIALIQMDCVFGDKAANMEKAERLVQMCIRDRWTPGSPALPTVRVRECISACIWVRPRAQT